MRKFEVVREDMRKTDGEVTLPTRASRSSVGYDIYANADYKVNPNGIAKIWSDVKAQFNHGEALLIDVRSSMGGKFMLANTLGVVEPDYYSNESNDGNLGVFLKNISDEVQYIKRGDRIAQCFFVPILFTDDDVFDGERKGGFGSSNEQYDRT